MTKNKITVAAALEKIARQESLENFIVDFTDTHVEALNVMKLTKAGITVPEEVIFYKDTAIEPDEEFEGPWQQIEADPIQEAQRMISVTLSLRPEIKQWIVSEGIDLKGLLERVVEDLFDKRQGSM